MSLGEIAAAPLEDWLRERYFAASVDISSSGVLNYTLGELRALLGVDVAELDDVIFRDSPSTGCEPLREAVAARFAPGRADRTMVTHGSTEGIFLALAALLRPGDEVVVLDPVYHALSAVARACGARLRVWELRAEDDFRPDLDLLERQLSPRTRAVVVNFPHNPTGACLDAAGRRRLAGLLARYDCHLFWDAAFGELVYDDGPPVAAPGEADGLPTDRVVSTGTLSKAYGLPGIRVGWCVAEPRLLAEMVRIRDYTTISTSPLNELLALRVLRDADRVLLPRLELARRNRTTLLEWAARHPGLVGCPPPVGGVSAFPRFPSVPDVTEACESLLREHGVLVVPGRCFGRPDRMRIGFGGDAGELTEGLDRVARVLGDASLTVPSRGGRSR
ncbi:capreomycidine synthase [Streptomyces castrisilvae]|uniref:Capreomycidine synthase n=1 Tax=Streptomyces castrisilvae TaxID=3033811 RepID=A0ABY9HCP0_9ACTN|nr:capreomycidine synthase [Streptomyces sp. Mut1]WLQ32265.1 capreomycidine synthase [Streptomyces sp. Mut1]